MGKRPKPGKAGAFRRRFVPGAAVLPSGQRERQRGPGAAGEPRARGMAKGYAEQLSGFSLLNQPLGAFPPDFLVCSGVFFHIYYLFTMNEMGSLSSGSVFVSPQLNNTWGGESSTEDLSRGSV